MAPLQEETTAGSLTAQLEAKAQDLTSGCVGPKDVLSTPPATQAGMLARPLSTAPGSGPARAAWRTQG